MRLDYAKALPDAGRAMASLEAVVEHSTLEPRLRELVKLRASQLKWLHVLRGHAHQDARAIGETERRLHLAAVWREAPVYFERERAALA